MLDCICPNQFCKVRKECPFGDIHPFQDNTGHSCLTPNNDCPKCMRLVDIEE
jgi:hypothetical protein